MYGAINSKNKLKEKKEHGCQCEGSQILCEAKWLSFRCQKLCPYLINGEGENVCFLSKSR